MKIKTKQNGGFTLVELLVVIAIIAVLSAMATPAIMGALKKAKITKSNGVCTSFEIAVNNFESEYNYLPFVGTTAPPDNSADDESKGGVLNVLVGLDPNNHKEIRFFELNKPKGSSSANFKDGLDLTTTNADLYDPWGNPYYISIDYELSGKITDPYGGDDITGKRVLIYSKGPDQEEGFSTAKNRDNPSNFK